jgi:predicted acylesterase/phospholipase RssA
MGTQNPFGLALSGGGFRAAAFHLGVLKRLRELGLLQKVDVVSTVSGGSITGAYWVYWQATKGDTLNSNQEWDRFECSLIEFMRGGIRGRAMLLGLYLPTLVLWSLAGAILWGLGPMSLILWCLTAGIAGAAAAYTFWHYVSSTLLEREYDTRLFSGATMKSLALSTKLADGKRFWPRLIINCTALNTGHLVVFTHEHPRCGPALWELDRRPRPRGSSVYRDHQIQKLYQEMSPVPMSVDTRLAKAVAASSCFPGVFSPLKMCVGGTTASRLAGHWYERSRVPYSIRLIDGGVFDNQGTYSLMEAQCRGLIVSDAAAELREDAYPSTWLVFPPGRGVVFRSQNIIYGRLRALGEKRLTESLKALGPPTSAEVGPQETGHQGLQGYAYLRLLMYGTLSDCAHCLSELLMRHVALMRTDFDRFSDVEISILMFHGYSVVEQTLLENARTRRWLEKRTPEAAFHSADANITWDPIPMKGGKPVDEMAARRQTEILRHIEPSDSRCALVRRIRRFRNRRRSDFDSKILNQRRSISQAVLTVQRKEESNLRARTEHTRAEGREG